MGDSYRPSRPYAGSREDAYYNGHDDSRAQYNSTRNRDHDHYDSNHGNNHRSFHSNRSQDHDYYDTHRDEDFAQYESERGRGYNHNENSRNSDHNNSNHGRRYDDYNTRHNGGHDHSRARSPPRVSRHFGNADSGFVFRGAAAAAEREAAREAVPQFDFRASGPSAPSFPPERYHNRHENRTRRAPPPSGRYPGPKSFGKAAHKRVILNRDTRQRTPEQLEGMNANSELRFNDIDQAFKHSEKEKARKRALDDEDATAQKKPKWSNPDPYTALPPPGAGNGPKVDILQVIRSSKAQAQSDQLMETAVKDNDDFISFDFDGKAPTKKQKLVHPSEKLTSVVVKSTSAPGLAANDNLDRLSFDSLNMVEDPQSSGTGMPDSIVAEAPLPTKPRLDRYGDEIPCFKVDTKSKQAPANKKRKAKGPLDKSDEEPYVDRSVPPGLQLKSFTREELRKKVAEAEKKAAEDQGNGKDQQKSRDAAALTDKKHATKARTLPLPPSYDRVPNHLRMLNEWEWDSADYPKSVPWHDGSKIAPGPKTSSEVSVMLHNEVRAFLHKFRATSEEKTVRQDLIEQVNTQIKKWLPGVDFEVHPFGSFASLLFLPTADMDLVVVSKMYIENGVAVIGQDENGLRELAQLLRKSGIAARGQVTCITKARVPLIKFTERDSGIKVDISFENSSGLKAIETFNTWKQQYPAMNAIVLLLKQLVAMHGLNEVFTGGIGGFSIICLVVTLFEHTPRNDWSRKVGKVDDDIKSGHINYGDLLLNFLEFYGKRFDYQQTGIKMNPPMFYNKATEQIGRAKIDALTIIDPNKAENDIAGGSNKIRDVLELFKLAHDDLSMRIEEMKRGSHVEKSILGAVWAGNYERGFSGPRRIWTRIFRDHLEGRPVPALLPLPDLTKMIAAEEEKDKLPRQRFKRGGNTYRPAQRAGSKRSRSGGDRYDDHWSSNTKRPRYSNN